jgi:hypothetical protein
MFKIYYIEVMGKNEDGNEFTLLVTQERSVISLSDGVPLLISFGVFDMQKNLLFKLSEGNSTV